MEEESCRVRVHLLSDEGARVERKSGRGLTGRRRGDVRVKTSKGEREAAWDLRSRGINKG